MVDLWTTEGQSRSAPSDTDSFLDKIRRQALRATERQQQQQNTNPLDQLMQQIQAINAQATPYDQLFSQAQGSAGAQFDPLIEQLQAEMNQTTKRGKGNQKEAKAMYSALAQDIAAQMPEITNQMAQASQETENRYNATQQELQGQYDIQAQEQAELYKKLGIQAAGPEASQQAMEDQAYFQNQSQTDEDAALALLNQMKNADVTYNRESASNTRLAGVNTAQDIGRQLEDYLQVAGGKMTGLKSGKESAIQAMLAQLQQQDAERVQQQESTEYDRLMDMFNLQLKMQGMANKSGSGAGAAGGLFKGTSGPSGASNFLSEVYPENAYGSKDIMSMINDVMGATDSGKTNRYGEPEEISDEDRISMLRKMMQDSNQGNKGSDPDNIYFESSDINNAISALLAYMGKLK